MIKQVRITKFLDIKKNSYITFLKNLLIQNSKYENNETKVNTAQKMKKQYDTFRTLEEKS